MLNRIHVPIFLLLFGLSCGDESRQVSGVGKPNGSLNSSSTKDAVLQPSPTQNSSIRTLNFYNFTYHWYPKWEHMMSKEKEFTLRNGKTEIDVPSGSNEPSTFELVNIQYGDITGDGAEDAIITIKMDVMGNSMPYVVFVYTKTDIEPKMLWAHETGDRADEGLRNVYMTDDHLLAIEQYTVDKFAGLCCPKTFTRTFYKWDDSQFQKFREETHPNNYKDARVIIGAKTASD
jgi:hypothetical protein